MFKKILLINESRGRGAYITTSYFEANPFASLQLNKKRIKHFIYFRKVIFNIMFLFLILFLILI